MNARSNTRQQSFHFCDRKSLGRKVALLTLLIACVGVSVSQVPVKTVESVKRAVVPILCVRFDANHSLEFVYIVGSGFFINRDGHVLTAAHVIAGLNTYGAQHQCSGGIYIPLTSWKDNSTRLKPFEIGECISNADTDVAVCKAKSNPFLDIDVKDNISALTLGSVAAYDDGSAVAFTGFPLEFVSPVTSKGYIATYVDFRKELVIDKNTWPGASGSPVYDERGIVLGMIIKRGLDEGTGLAYARPADSIIEFLREKKITAQQEDNKHRQPVSKPSKRRRLHTT